MTKKKPAQRVLFFKGMPTDLIDQVKAKGDRMVPRQTLKDTVIRLFQKFMEENGHGVGVVTGKVKNATKPAPKEDKELF